MGNGWETKRRRGKGYDWVVIKLADIGVIEDINIQTHYFKGNYPAYFTIQGAMITSKSKIPKLIKDSEKWHSLISKTKLKSHNELKISLLKTQSKKINYIKLSIFPDGGISRLRVYGKIL